MQKKQSHFNRAAPHPRIFYEREFGQLAREDRNGWARVKSGPFHPSESKRSFFVHRDGGFFGHGCGAKGGDVLSYMRRRYNLGFKEAAQQLGAWTKDIQQQREIHRRQ